MTITLLCVAGFLLALLGHAVLAAAETAVVGLRPGRVSRARRRGTASTPAAKALVRVLSQKEIFLGCSLLGEILCNVAAALLLIAALHSWFPDHWLAAVGTVLIVALDFMVFGQLLPQYFGQQYPLETGLALSPLMSGTLTLFGPIARSFGRISSVLVKLAGRVSPPKFSFVTREELKLLTPKTPAKTDPAPGATQMIHGVFDMRQKAARDLMIPLQKATIVAPTATTEEMLAAARATGFSRLPVVEKAEDGKQKREEAAAKKASGIFQNPLPMAEGEGRIIGIVNIYDVLYDANPDASSGKTAADYLRRPPLVADTDSPDRVLQRLRAARVPMAIVANAQQQAIGLITVENIVAQIVGKANAS